MSETYRQKLLNWFTSMLVVLLLVATLALHHWFVIVPEFVGSGRDDDLFWSYGLGDALFFYVIGALPLFAWHAFDFIQIGKPVSRSAAFFDKYRVILLGLVVMGSTILLHATPWLNDLFCPEPNLPEEVFQFDGCGSWTPAWKVGLFSLSAIFLVALVLGKGAVAVRSRLRNAI